MRDDRSSLGAALVDSPEWEKNRDPNLKKGYYVTQDEEGRPVARVHPFSGGERNRFYANVEGQFQDLSAISGADTPADSRSFGYFDLDRDGDHDLALTNSNSPSFQIWKTEVRNPGNFIVVTLEGGAVPGDESGWSNRSAVGALVTVTTSTGRKLVRELHAGEGFGSQNSKTLIFGIGKETEVKEIQVRWPSSRSSSVTKPITEGSLVEFQERGEPTVSSYQR